jgi:hypothetical protein
MTNRWISFFVTVETLVMGADRCYEPFWAMDGIRLDSVAWRCVGWSSCLSSAGLHHRSGGVARESSKEVSVSSSTAKEEDGRSGSVRSGPINHTIGGSGSTWFAGARAIASCTNARGGGTVRNEPIPVCRCRRRTCTVFHWRQKERPRPFLYLPQSVRYDTIRYDTCIKSSAAKVIVIGTT